jgi:ATP-binding cassette subfamily B protein
MPEKKPEIQGRESLLGIYARHTKRYPWLLALVIIATVGMQGAALASPLYLRQFFNTLTLHSANASIVHQLTITLAFIFGLQLTDWVFRRVQSYSILYMESRVMTDLLSTAFDYLLGHSYNFFISHFAGSLTHRVSRFGRGYEVVLDSIMLQFFPTVLFVLGAVIILFIRNHTLGFILAGWVLCFVSFQLWVAKIRQPIRAIRAEEDSKVTGALADAVANQNTVALFSGVKFENVRFRDAVVKWRAATWRVWNADEWIWAGQGLFMIIINIALLYGAMRYWEQGLLTIGDFVLIQAYLITAFNLLLGISRELRRFYDIYADAKEMVEVLNLAHGIADKPSAKPLVVSGGKIEFRDVDFFFTDRPVLEKFNLDIKPNEKIALVGPSGAGKSTITKLLLRLYDVKSGSIEIDGQNVAEVTQESLRNSIAFVPQEPVLFHRTLMENIRYGRREASDEEVIAAAKAAHCHEFIMAQPDGYDAFVGERGIKLSGGERQRVAIARAILKDAPILILDEATSSLDSESEALIQDALETLMKKKTVLVIAHRLSTIMKMDRIIVMQNGKIAAEGTHQELLTQGGLYHKLWSIQAGGFLADTDEVDVNA